MWRRLKAKVLGISIYGRVKTKVSKNVEDANTIMRCKRACVHVVCPCLNWLAKGGGGGGGGALLTSN